MKMKTTSERKIKLEQGPEAEVSRARYREWRTLASVLLCLLPWPTELSWILRLCIAAPPLLSALLHRRNLDGTFGWRAV